MNHKIMKNEKLNRETLHEEIGLNEAGQRIYKCTVSGDIKVLADFSGQSHKMLRNEKLGRLTPHEDLGLNNDGKHMYKCSVTGDLRGISKAQREQMIAQRTLKNVPTEDVPEFKTIKDQDISHLKDYID